MSRGDQNDVDPDRISGPRIFCFERMRRSSNPLEPVLINREIELGRCGARFDLNERNRAPAARDQVNLAVAGFDTARHDRPTVKSQPPGRTLLAPMAALFGSSAAHSCRANAR